MSYEFKPSASSPGLTDPLRVHFSGAELEYFGVEKNHSILYSKFQTYFSQFLGPQNSVTAPRDRAGATSPHMQDEAAAANISKE